MGNSSLQIGEIAVGAGVTVDTVRYYERQRLLPKAPRTSGGYRVFSSTAIEQIRFIKQAQELGFSLDEIRGLLTSGGAEECRQVRELLRQKLVEMDEQIKNMKVFRKALARHYTVCNEEYERNGPNAHCPVLFEVEK